MTVLCYDKCTTCRKALRWLDEKKAAYTVRPIKEEHPSYEELSAWWKKSGRARSSTRKKTNTAPASFPLMTST